MYSSGDEQGNFPEFSLQKKNYGFKWNKLDFDEGESCFIFHESRLNFQQEKIFDFQENEFNIEKNVHITDGLQMHYEHKQKCLSFLLKIENINGILQNGQDLKRMTYFKPMSLGQASLIYDIFEKFEEKIYESHKIPHNQLLDEGLI